ncbi:MAG: phosphoribosylanthranilate isomerase [Candidatus Hydrothermarchaeota archaeon]|nr:phosphoribosylanthranilate isomerase [Candidatus Hydrothermarchaeota archaeon]
MVLVKICGNTSRGDSLKALELGADLIGVIVEVPTATPRKVSASKAREILSDIHGKDVIVIMPEDLEQALDYYDRVAPSYVQLHGGESVDFVKELRKAVQCNLIKTIHVAGRDAVEEALEYAPYCDYLLLDTLSAGMGGSGLKHDWTVSKEIVHSAKVPVILAGGLNPGNVEDAVRIVKPYAIDVSSGVESRPGKKDYEKVKNFIAAAKQA